jgi:signal recognition particle receptor subunit beta
LGEAKLSEVPVLIFANKQDIQMSLSAEEVMELMELNNIMNRMWSIFACSAIKGDGKYII